MLFKHTANGLIKEMNIDKHVLLFGSMKTVLWDTFLKTHCLQACKYKTEKHNDKHCHFSFFNKKKFVSNGKWVDTMP